MPRTTNHTKLTPHSGEDAALSPLDTTLDEIRMLLEARRVEYMASADRIGEIIQSMAPKPRIGRPPKAR